MGQELTLLRFDLLTYENEQHDDTGRKKTRYEACGCCYEKLLQALCIRWQHDGSYESAQFGRIILF